MIKQIQKIKKCMIDFHKLGRLVILNEEIYLLSEKRYIQVFRINKPIPKLIKISDGKWEEEHQKLCDKIRKHGKLMGEVDRILRDD